MPARPPAHHQSRYRSIALAAADREHDRPQPERDAAVPRQRRQADRRQDQHRGDQRRAGGGQVAGDAGERVDGEDDAEVLEQAERALALERVAEDPVPDGERVERRRPVQVEEVDVGHLALLHQSREDEHEALFHRRPGRLVQASQRQRDGDRDRQPRQQRRDRGAVDSPAKRPPSTNGSGASAGTATR